MLLAESLLGTSSTAANYIEDVFSTYLYTGNGTDQTITNGIDLSGKGGLVWIKPRTVANPHYLCDTIRGINKFLESNSTAAEQTSSTSGGNTGDVNAFNSNGFGVGSTGRVNQSAQNFASWTFRKQPKFFDIVTYTGNGVTGRTISHNLGSVPGCIIVKSTSAGGTDWTVFHRSINAGRYGFIVLNQTNAAFTSTAYDWNPTSTTFIPQSWLNDNGATYVAYLFAHDAGGFGATGADNVISCGSFTTDGSGNATVSLGYEPQWILYKSSSAISDWDLLDTMRGWFAPSTAGNALFANSSSAEIAGNDNVWINATGFTASLTASRTYIYIAIRRGPMRTPTTGTSVFSIGSVPNGSSAQRFTGDFFDLDVHRTLSSTSDDWRWADKLRGITSIVGGNGQYLASNSTAAEVTLTDSIANKTSSLGVSGFDNKIRAYLYTGQGGVQYGFRRAPGFFDVVCYTGTGVARTINHNLGIAPEIYIVKPRTTALASNAWWVNCAYLPTPSDDSLVLNSAGANNTGNGALLWNSTRPTSTVFSIGTYNGVNTSDTTFVAYLFATVAGVSKVGSYTGTGTTKQIDCGFTAGARFVLIKRTDSTGDWYVWDSARGIVAGNDPYWLLNSAAAQVTGTDYVDTYSAGFEISSTAPAAINANGGSFIFLAIA